MRAAHVPWALCAALAPVAARAERPLRPRNVVTWQPLSVATGYVDLEYERALGRRFSVYVAPGAIFARGRHLDGSHSAGLFAWSVDVGGRWFVFGDAPSGLFADVSGGFASSSLTGGFGERVRGDGWRAMALAGYSLIVARHFVTSVGLGAQVVGFEREGGNGYQWNVWPALRVAVGVSF